MEEYCSLDKQDDLFEQDNNDMMQEAQAYEEEFAEENAKDDTLYKIKCLDTTITEHCQEGRCFVIMAKSTDSNEWNFLSAHTTLIEAQAFFPKFLEEHENYDGEMQFQIREYNKQGTFMRDC